MNKAMIGLATGPALAANSPDATTATAKTGNAGDRLASGVIGTR